MDVKSRLAAAACAEQGQLWRIDANGMPDGDVVAADQVVEAGPREPSLLDVELPGRASESSL